MPTSSRREFLSQIACAFAVAGIPCRTVIPAEPEPERLPTGDYFIGWDFSKEPDKTFVCKFINFHEIEMRSIISYQNAVLYGKFGQGI